MMYKPISASPGEGSRNLQWQQRLPAFLPGLSVLTGCGKNHVLLRSGKIRSFRVKVSQDSFGYLASIFPKMIDFSRRSLRTAFFPHPVKIGNFRALRNVEFDGLTPLSVLLGPNGSGKSTFFDVFAFLSDCFSEGLRRAVDKRGVGLKDLRSRDSKGSISFEIAYREGYRKIERQPHLITYHLDIDEDDGHPVVAQEWMRWKRSSYGAPFYFLKYARGAGSVVTGDVPEREDQRVDKALSGPDILAVSTLGQFAENPRVKALRDFVTGWHRHFVCGLEALLT